MDATSDVLQKTNYEKEKDKLKSLLETLDGLPCSPSSEEDIWYVVNKKFLDKVRFFVSEENSKNTTECPSVIKNKKFLEDSFNVDEKTRLLDEYKNGNGIYFVLYPKEGIQLLEYFFHFDVLIPRAVYPFIRAHQNGRINYKVDIQPLKLTVFSKNPNTRPNPPKSVILILKKYTIEDVLVEINGGFKGEHLKRNLYYSDDFYSNNKEWQCLYLSNSEEYSVKKKVCEFSINEKSCLLITNERPDVKCLTNDNVDFYYNSHGDKMASPSLPDDGSLLNVNIQYIFDHGGDRGLINLGNTCFLNSSLQCLSKVLKFSNYFLSGKFWKDINYSNPVGQNGKLAKAYYETLMEMWKINKRSGPYAPRMIKQAISEKRDEFYGYQQHDSQELLAYLLDGLHEDLNLITKKPYYEEKLQGGVDKSDVEVAEASWKRHKEINNSIIVDLFQGQYRSRLQCPQCKKVSITFDPFMYLSIPIPPKKNHRIWFHVMLNTKVPTCFRFSCSFKGSQEVVELKTFFLNIVKNLKERKQNTILHSKSIIRNQEDNKEDTHSFNFHWRCLDEFFDINDDGDENEDYINYANIIKESAHINSTLTDEDINLIYECICEMCNITNINKLNLEHVIFFQTKFKNLACNSFFHLLNNTDSVMEPHTRIGQGLSHIFVFLLSSSSFNHLMHDTAQSEECSGKNYKIETKGHVDAIGNTRMCGQFEDRHVKREKQERENMSEENMKKLIRKRKVMSPNALRNNGTNGKVKGENEQNEEGKEIKGEQDEDPADDDEDEEEEQEEETPERERVEEGDNNGKMKEDSAKNVVHTYPDGSATAKPVESGEEVYLMNCNVNMKYAENNRAKEEMLNGGESINITNGININGSSNGSVVHKYDNDPMNLNHNEDKLGSNYFTILIIPICKEDHPIYRMKNNDLPILFNAPMNLTSIDLYKRIREGYFKKKSTAQDLLSEKGKEKSKGKGKGKGKGKEKCEDTNASKKLSNLLGKVKNEETETDNCKMSMVGNKNEDPYEMTDNSSKTFINGVYNNISNEEENSTLYGKERETSGKSSVSKEEHVDDFRLYIPGYNLKDDLEPCNDLGIELKTDDDTYIVNYIKNIKEKKVIIIYLNSSGITKELSNDIKTLTFIDLEERYGIDLCLKQFSEEEHLDENNTWYCSNCKLHVQAFKKLDLFRMPIILILHLKRFNNTNRWIRSKVDSYVHYPHKQGELLNMTPYILPDGLMYMKEQTPDYEPVYELIAVNCHTGNLSGGHYFAYVKLRDKWYNFNDSFVTKVDESEVNTKNAYLLFYQLLSHKNEKFDFVAKGRHMTEEEAIAIANASYYG